MQAFKIFLKIISRKFLISFLIYTLIFVGVMTFFSTSDIDQIEDAFELSQVRISVINNDNTPLANGLEKYINSIGKPVEIKKDDSSIKDALFFRETEFIVTIPQDFQKNFSSSNQQMITTMSIPDSTSSQYATTVIDNYLNTAKLYITAYPEMPMKKINQKVYNDISKEANISFLNPTQNNNNDLSGLNTYFNFLSYLLLAMLVSMVGRVMLIFNNKEIKMRHFCSPVSNISYNLQIIFCNFFIASTIWIIFLVLGFVINSSFYQINSLLFVVNSFVLTVFCLSLSFFVSTFSTKNSIDPIANCLSLGLAFLGGPFIPQDLLSDKLSTIAIFNPLYWYVKVNDSIVDITSFSFSTLQPVIYGIIVQLAFAFAILAIALVVIKQKRQAL
ncbi:ABC transporter permease [Proteinivorax tanatarense]|uniref:ABC transporter permease n=1 Tax=Proteinivorax tanatarense TaxID=1260629 RepID=A0AAU7VK08_9FIRM